MVMRQDDSGRPARQGRPEDLPRLQGGHVESTDRHALASHRLVAGVEVEDRKALSGAGSKILELEDRLFWRRYRRRGTVWRNVPASGQFPNGEQAPNLSGPKPMASRGLAKVHRRPL